MFGFKTLGSAPAGERLQRIQKSPNYKNGSFQNIHPTFVSTEDVPLFATLQKMLFDKSLEPHSSDYPFVQTDLKTLNDEAPTLVWFGHSSYLIKYRGKNILVDPVFSGHASPTSYLIQAFKGTDQYSVKDLPKIDVLLITHDHYDHLDFLTVQALKDHVAQVITPLGVGEHLESWGWNKDVITELDWWETKELPGMKFTATPARHFSGRSYKRALTLWASFVLELDHTKIFIGGDSGYDDQFKKIGEKWGSFDLAILENGQYNEGWPHIHMFPEQTVQAAQDLHAKVLMPVHWGKFKLSLHAWDEPIKRVSTKAQEVGMPMTTPRIGEPLVLGKPLPQTDWWTWYKDKKQTP